MKTYKVKGNLKHDGNLFTKGQTIDLDEKIAVQLLSDQVIAEIDTDVDDEERETPQPAVNKVSREKGETNGEAKVEPGKGDKPEDEEEDAPEVPTKAPYKVLKGLEYPKGTVYKVDDIIELTDEQATKFAEGLVEKVEVADEDNL